MADQVLAALQATHSHVDEVCNSQGCEEVGNLRPQSNQGTTATLEATFIFLFKTDLRPKAAKQHDDKIENS